MACKGKDRDLARVTKSDCVAACQANRTFAKTVLNIDRTEINKSAWRCAEANTACDVLDHTCDVF